MKEMKNQFVYASEDRKPTPGVEAFLNQKVVILGHIFVIYNQKPGRPMAWTQPAP